MGETAGEDSAEQVRFVPATGSTVGGVTKSKAGRVTDAMADLQLGIDGLRSQLARSDDRERWSGAMAAFARTCSVFLRETVLGDYGRRERRLLDDRMLRSTGLRFDRLGRIPRDRRRTIRTGFGLGGGFMEATKLDDATGKPEASYRLEAGRQGVELSIEWPLPGAADWTGVPTEESPWPVGPAQLFERSGTAAMDCDAWLAQQVCCSTARGSRSAR